VVSAIWSLSLNLILVDSGYTGFKVDFERIFFKVWSLNLILVDSGYTGFKVDFERIFFKVDSCGFLRNHVNPVNLL
jgi:hypothetical protein